MTREAKRTKRKWILKWSQLHKGKKNKKKMNIKMVATSQRQKEKTNKIILLFAIDNKTNLFYNDWQSEHDRRLYMIVFDFFASAFLSIYFSIAPKYWKNCTDEKMKSFVNKLFLALTISQAFKLIFCAVVLIARFLK